MQAKTDYTNLEGTRIGRYALSRAYLYDSGVPEFKTAWLTTESATSMAVGVAVGLIALIA